MSAQTRVFLVRSVSRAATPIFDVELADLFRLLPVSTAAGLSVAARTTALRNGDWQRRRGNCIDNAAMDHAARDASVLGFYRKRLAEDAGVIGQSGAVSVTQRVSSDLRLNPHPTHSSLSLTEPRLQCY